MFTSHGTTVKLKIDPKSVQYFAVLYQYPFSLKKKLEPKPQRLDAEGVISPVHLTNWAIPTVVVTCCDITATC